MFEEIEKASEVFPPSRYRDYFSDVITVFRNPERVAITIEEKLRVLENIEEIIDELEEKYSDSLAIDAALAYIKCGGDAE